MNFLIHIFGLCALLLGHVPIVTGYYYGLSNPWNWFGRWQSVAPTENVTFVNTTSLVETVSPMSTQVRRGKAYNEISLPEQSRILKALIEVVGNITAQKNEKTLYIEKEKLVLANQLPLDQHTNSSPLPDFAETTTFAPVFDSVNIEWQTQMPSTENIKNRQSISFGKASLSGIFTTLASEGKQIENLLSTTILPVETTTGAAVLSTDYASSFSHEKEASAKTEGFSTISVYSVESHTSSPFKEFLYGNLKERVPVSTSSDNLVADLSTPVTNKEETIDSITSVEHLLKLSDINTEASTVSSKNVLLEKITSPANIASANVNDTFSPVTITTINTNSINISPEIEQKTTVKSSLGENKSDTVNEEVTTENPTKQFIRELIALKERQIKLKADSNVTTSEQSGSVFATTSRSISNGDEMGSTSISVEVNTRSFISQNGPLFLFFTTSTPSPAVDAKVVTNPNYAPLITEPTFERENRMLPFAFYNNQAVGKPADEGHFVSSFQDFYSDKDIFKGMMPAYVSKSKPLTNNVEMNSYWFDSYKKNY